MDAQGISNDKSTRIIFIKKLLFCLYALCFVLSEPAANSGPAVQEHVLVDQNSMQVIFIEEWVKDSNEIIHPGSFAAINSIIEEEGQWYFAGTYFYKDAPDASEVPAIIQMFQKTYENMILFLENEDVDQVYDQICEY